MQNFHDYDWHNPQGLTPEEVGWPIYRPLLKTELDNAPGWGEYSDRPSSSQADVPVCWYESGYLDRGSRVKPADRVATYRVLVAESIPLPELYAELP